MKIFDFGSKDNLTASCLTLIPKAIELVDISFALKQENSRWYYAAKAALAGDTRDLKELVEERDAKPKGAK